MRLFSGILGRCRSTAKANAGQILRANSSSCSANIRNYCGGTTASSATSSYGNGNRFQVVVVGGGHAGTEAAAAAARMGCRTLLVTQKLETIGEMSCNPSFGGIGKGHLIKEIDALDGLCAKACDVSGVQYKMLNRSKGYAVRGPRAQIDRKLYKEAIQRALFQDTPNLEIRAGSVDDLMITENNTAAAGSGSSSCRGILLEGGERVEADAVVLTTGTFLRGQINFGTEAFPAGRMGDGSAVALAQTLERLQFRLGRMKTGTPPRIAKDSIDFSQMIVHYGDSDPIPFSFLNDRVWLDPEEQLPCHMTFTNQTVEDICVNNVHLNRHVISEEVTGPRYCPSIESKVMKFGGKPHQVWLEPEGFDNELVYPQGLSCTLPENLQQQLINSIRGLEKAVVVKPGYGVEYDFVDPRELHKTFETKKIPGLFFAGQINGTTGYEEAAGQGLVAGVNAAVKAKAGEESGCERQQQPLILDRTESYIGVLVDDLTSAGTNEPYRMFTSRAEFRLHLRPENADIRLTEKGWAAGCVGQNRYRQFRDTAAMFNQLKDALKSEKRQLRKWIGDLKVDNASRKKSTSPDMTSAWDMMTVFSFNVDLRKLAGVFNYDESSSCCSKTGSLIREALRTHGMEERLKVEALYEAFIADQQHEFDEIRREEQMILPTDIDYRNQALNLSAEDREKLALTQPTSIGSASRIPGMTPSAIISLLRFVKKQQKQTTLHVMNKNSGVIVS